MADHSPNALFTLTHKTAVVTGASSGLGRACAEFLRDAGADVIAVARRADKLAEVEGYASSGGEIRAVTADVTDRNAFPDMLAEINDHFGTPDILVNAAGLNTREAADEVTAEGWDDTLAINLTAPFALAQAFAPSMIERGWGRIINFASLQSRRAFPGGIAYGATKGGVEQLTRAMAEAWSSRGINANAIAPGFFPTELTAAVFNDPERAKRNAEQTCIGRNGTMEDMRGPLLFLASPASDYVTGQLLFVDGGFTAK